MYPPRDHYYPHPPPPPPPPHVQGVRGPSATLYPPMASSSPSYGFPPGNFAPPQNTINRGGPSGSEMGQVQPTGFRIYQRDDSVPLAALRQHRGGVPRFRMMPDDVCYFLSSFSLLPVLCLRFCLVPLNVCSGSCDIGVWRLPWWWLWK